MARGKCQMVGGRWQVAIRPSLLGPRNTPCVKWVAMLILLLAWGTSSASAHDKTPHTANNILDQLGFDQRLEAQVPLGLTFQDETGRKVQLGDYFGEKPVVLVMGYFECPNLCSMVRVGLLDTLKEMRFQAGEEFEVVLVSIDPAETAEVATRVKAETMAQYARPGSEDGWHFLTGEHAAVDQLAEAVGFRFAYDAEQAQYAHASGLVILTPAGKIARYLFGLEYAPRDLRLGLVEAADNRIGSPVDQLLLFCYHYNPNTGQYTLAILSAIRWIGTAFVVGLGWMLWRLMRHEPREPATPA